MKPEIWFDLDRLTPRAKVEIGRDLIYLIFFSLYWPISFWFYYTVQAPIARWWWQWGYMPIKRILDAIYLLFWFYKL